MLPVRSLRAIVSAVGSTPSSYDSISLLRQYVSALGGTPTGYNTVSLLRQALAATGGTPTSYNKIKLLRQILTAQGLTPESYSATKLADQLIMAPPVANDRISPLSTFDGGREATVPRAYFDAVYAEAHDTNTHPDLQAIFGAYTHSAVQGGKFSSTATWGGAIPGAGAIVNVASALPGLPGPYVEYDVESSAEIKAIHIGGTSMLMADPTLDTKLVIDTLFLHGTLQVGTADDPIENSSTNGKARCEIVIKTQVDPGVTVTGGVVTMGKVTMVGATKTAEVECSSDPQAGDTVLQLTSPLSGARVGDEILVLATDDPGSTMVDTHYTGPTSYYGRMEGQTRQNNQTGYSACHSEKRTITAINGDLTQVTVAALDFDHDSHSATIPARKVLDDEGNLVTQPAYTRTLKPYVRMLSQSIQIRGDFTGEEGSGTTHRGHCMFMHDDRVYLKGVRFLDLGRTRVDKSLNAPIGLDSSYAAGGNNTLKSTSGGVAGELVDANNVRGRYPCHIHGTGPFRGRKAAIVVQCVVDSSESGAPVPGWGFVAHNSRVNFEDCTSYRVRGAGFVWELGNEIGQVVNCASIYNVGDGFASTWGSPQQDMTNMNGSAGVGFECQSRSIRFHNCRVRDSRVGWMWLLQHTNLSARSPQAESLTLRDPLAFGQTSDNSAYTAVIGNSVQGGYGAEQTQIADFTENECIAWQWGITAGERNQLDRTDTIEALFKKYTYIGGGTAIHLSGYTFNYYFYEVWDKKTGAQGGTTLYMGEFGSQLYGMMLVGSISENRNNVKIGGDLNYHGHIIDCVKTTGSWGHSRQICETAAVTDHEHFDVMGTWVHPISSPPSGVTNTAGNWWVEVRTYVNLNSDTDLPLLVPNAPEGLADSAEPAPGAPKPYYFSRSTDLTLPATGVGTLSIEGTIVDHVGIRRFPDGFTWGRANGHAIPRPPKKNFNITGQDLLSRNGWYDDNGTPKMRLYMPFLERLTGSRLFAYEDVTLTGTYNAALLAAHQLADPADALPDVSSLERIDQYDHSFAPDLAPVDIELTAVTGAALSTDTYSQAFTLSGMTPNYHKVGSITGAAGAKVSVNGGTPTTTPVVVNGDSLRIMIPSSGSVSTPLTADLDIGGTIFSFSVTTTAVAYETETNAYLAAMSSSPDGTRSALLNNLIKGLKDDGDWTSLDALYVLAAHDEQAGRVNAKTPGTYNLTAVSSPTFTVDRGYTGTATTSGAYLQTAYAFASGDQNNASMGFWSRTTGQVAGTEMGNSNSVISARNTSNEYSGRINTGTTFTGSGITDGSGLFVASRTASNITQHFRNGVQIGANQTNASTTPDTSTIRILGRATSTSTSTRECAFAFIGKGLSAAAVARVYNRINTYLTAVGAA